MKKLDILVIEDNQKHQNAAKQLLAEHNVGVASSFDTAKDELVGAYVGKFPNTYFKEPHHYDVVLTDLLFPQGRGDGQNENGLKLASIPMAFGFPIVIIAAIRGVPYNAIVTDMNHHQHPMAYTFDHIKDKEERACPIKMNQSICMMFDIRDLPACYLLKDGNITNASPYDAPENERGKYIEIENFIQRGFESKYELVKNWKAALDKLLKKPAGENRIKRVSVGVTC